MIRRYFLTPDELVRLAKKIPNTEWSQLHLGSRVNLKKIIEDSSSPFPEIHPSTNMRTDSLPVYSSTLADRFEVQLFYIEYPNPKSSFGVINIQDGDVSLGNHIFPNQAGNFVFLKTKYKDIADIISDTEADARKPGYEVIMALIPGE